MTNSPTSDNRTAICLVCDTGFNPYACFTAASISVVPEHADLDIFIFTEGLSDAEARFMEQFRNVRPVVIENLSLPLFESPSKVGISKACLYVIYLDRLLPAGEYDRIIYLDADIYVSGSLLDLAELEMEGHCLAAARGMEPASLKSAYRQLQDRDDSKDQDPAGDPYLNSGVLVIDLPRWREMGMEQKVADTILENPGITDEEAFNIILQGQWQELSPKWNFYAFLLGLGLETLFKPAVYHYMAAPKPWNSLFWNHDPVHRQRYLSFFRNSPWPRAAKLPVHPSRFRSCAIKKSQYLRKMYSPLRHLGLFRSGEAGQPGLRDLMINRYNYAVANRLYADHRQGLTELAPIELNAEHD